MPKRRTKKTVKATESAVPEPNEPQIQTQHASVHGPRNRRLSMAYPFEYSSNAAVTSMVGGRASFLGADNLHLKDFVFEEPSETQTIAVQEGLQTPGVNSQRLSVGMTPKTLRLPKPGEMLLSVHGSPLGVYKENNMEAIRESEEGCSG
ncbi:hypothetical protein SESBI_22528 [Sesbania bispinosa]|nr:hypothetical protein SESBI_22528 [Sesbania bispinosa]